MLKLLITVALIVLSGCSKCVEVSTVYRINKIPKISLKVDNNGGLDTLNRKKAFKLISQLRLAEDYYYRNAKAYNER